KRLLGGRVREVEHRAGPGVLHRSDARQARVRGCPPPASSVGEAHGGRGMSVSEEYRQGGALAGLRIVAFEARRAAELATMLGRHGAVVVRAPALREALLGATAEATDFVRR